MDKNIKLLNFQTLKKLCEALESPSPVVGEGFGVRAKNRTEDYPDKYLIALGIVERLQGKEAARKYLFGLFTFKKPG